MLYVANNKHILYVKKYVQTSFLKQVRAYFDLRNLYNNSVTNLWNAKNFSEYLTMKILFSNIILRKYITERTFMLEKYF